MSLAQSGGCERGCRRSADERSPRRTMLLSLFERRSAVAAATPPGPINELGPLLANHGGDERICAPKPSSERERVHGRRLLPSGEGLNKSLARFDRGVGVELIFGLPDRLTLYAGARCFVRVGLVGLRPSFSIPGTRGGIVVVGSIERRLFPCARARLRSGLRLAAPRASEASRPAQYDKRSANSTWEVTRLTSSGFSCPSPSFVDWSSGKGGRPAARSWPGQLP